MLKIFEIPELLSKRDELRDIFEKNRDNAAFAENAIDSLKKIDEWKYSTGSIFDQPPYAAEMAGFDGGRLLKKQYLNPYEARLKGAYSSGFIDGQHRITVSPSKPISIPLGVSHFKWENDVLHGEYIKYYGDPGFKSSKPPTLRGLNIFYSFDKNIRANVAVGDAGAFSITLYFYNEKNMIEAASSITTPFDFQSEYEMYYDENDVLVSVTSSDLVVWQKKLR